MTSSSRSSQNCGLVSDFNSKFGLEQARATLRILKTSNFRRSANVILVCFFSSLTSLVFSANKTVAAFDFFISFVAFKIWILMFKSVVTDISFSTFVRIKKRHRLGSDKPKPSSLLERRPAPGTNLITQCFSRGFLGANSPNFRKFPHSLTAIKAKQSTAKQSKEVFTKAQAVASMLYSIYTNCNLSYPIFRICQTNFLLNKNDDDCWWW